MKPIPIPSEHTRFKINSAHIVYEVIDGEAIVIHLTKGYYYSLDKVGTTIWNLIARETSWTPLLGNLSEHFDCEPLVVEKTITEFVQELYEEELILFQESDSAIIESLIEKPTTNGTHGSHSIFTKPILQKFTDMKDFLLVDPIHEVDETGWPHKKLTL